jgi:PAS domain S-box-containing protein
MKTQFPKQMAERSPMSQKTWPEELCVEKHFEQILDVLSDGVYISDRDGRTLMVNAMYERLTGLKRENLLGQHVRVLIDKGFDTVLNPRIVESGKPATSVQTHSNGNKLLLNGYPIFGEDGQVALVVTFVRDITLMTQLKDQIAAQSELIEKFKTNVRQINEENARKSPLIAQSAAMVGVIGYMEKIAGSDATVLLQGETGVGKDVLARKIHQISPRRNRPFFKVDCPTIPENLIESELFGYVSGAFSGAHAKGKIGFFEMVDKGTLFLDEIGELPLAMQTKLLRVLQDQEIVRVGSTKVRKVDVRIIAATNRDLETEVREGRFRSDLFYRLQVAVINIPPLRERKEDILPLTHQFLQRYSTRYKKEVRLGAGMEDLLLNYRWPGNVRELENLIQCLVVTSEHGRIDVSALPRNIMGDLADICAGGSLPVPEDAETSGGAKENLVYRLLENPENRSRSLKEIVAEIESDILRKALEACGSTTEVARRFQIDRATLFRKIRKGRSRTDRKTASDRGSAPVDHPGAVPVSLSKPIL